LSSRSAVGTMQGDKRVWTMEVLFEALAELFGVTNNGQFFETLPLLCSLVLRLYSVGGGNVDICPTCMDQRPGMLAFYRFGFDLSSRKSGCTFGNLKSEVPR